MSINERLAKLSPEKRQILLQKMQQNKAATVDTISRDKPEALPLSSAQQRIWLFEKMNHDANAYNIVSALRVTGPLNLPAMEWAFQQIVNRHSVLRTRFVPQSDEEQGVQQHVVDDVKVSIKCSNVATGLLKDSAALESHIAALADTTFDLSKLPLFRLNALSANEHQHVIVFVLHHMLADGWSLRLIEQELSRFYQAYLAGDRQNESPCQHQYGDYVVWQSKWLQSERRSKQLNYWRSLLTDAPRLLPLCDESQRERALTNLEASSLVLDIPNALLSELRAYSNDADSSVFMLLLASFKAALALVTGVEDLTIGTPTANRNRQQFEEVVGLFSNTLAIRSAPRRDSPFVDYLASLRHRTIGAYSNQELPFDWVVDDVVSHRAAHYSPLFQVLFALQAMEDSALTMEDLRIEPVHLTRASSEFDLVAELFLTDQQSNVVLSYRTALYRREFVDSLWQTTLALAASFIEKPSETLAQHYSCLGTVSTLALPDQSGANKVDPSQNTTKKSAYKALDSAGQAHTVDQLIAASNSIAAGFADKQQTAQFTLLIATTPLEWLAACNAMQHLGGNVCCVDAQIQPADVAYLLNSDTDTALCFAGQNGMPNVPEGMTEYRLTEWLTEFSGNAIQTLDPDCFRGVSFCEHGRLIELTGPQRQQSADFLHHQLNGVQSIVLDVDAAWDVQLCLIECAQRKGLSLHFWDVKGSSGSDIKGSSGSDIKGPSGSDIKGPSVNAASDLLTRADATLFVAATSLSALLQHCPQSVSCRIVYCGLAPDVLSTLSNALGCYSDESFGGAFMWLNELGECAIRQDLNSARVSNQLGDVLPENAHGELWLSDEQQIYRSTGFRAFLSDGIHALSLGNAPVWHRGRLRYLDHLKQAILSLDYVVDCVLHQRRADVGGYKLLCYVVVNQGVSEQQLSQAIDSPCKPDALIYVSHIPFNRAGEVDRKSLESLPVLNVAWLEKQIEPAADAETAIDDESESCLTLAWAMPEPTVIKVATSHVIQSSAKQLETEYVLDKGKPNVPEAVLYGKPLSAKGEQFSCLSQVLKQAAQQAGEQSLIFVESAESSPKVYSYAALYDSAAKIAGALSAQGVKPKDIVMLQLADNYRLTVAFWGCVLCGVVPIVAAAADTYKSDDAAATKIWQVCRSVPIVGIIACPHSHAAIRSADSFSEFNGVVADFDTLIQGPSIQQPYSAQTTETALMLLTSGSTGLPKAVMQTHRALISRTVGEIEAFDFNQDEVSFNWMPMDHVGGLVMHHLTYVYLGAKQIHCPTSVVLANPILWIHYLSDYQVTTTWAPNFAYSLVNECLNEDSATNQVATYDLSTLQVLYNGGEAVIAKVARQFFENLTRLGMRDGTMKPVWGMSETCSGVIVNVDYDPAQENANDIINVGQPLPGVNVRIVDASDQLLREGEVGRLQIGGDVITVGYRNNEEATQVAFTKDGWFCTGDLARIDQGCVTITGREKDLVIINGQNYHCQEIEQVVDKLSHVLTAHVAACGIRLPSDTNEKLAIFYSPQHSEHSESDVAADINRALLKVLGIPVSYLVCLEPEQFPRTSIGKIQRADLIKHLEAGDYQDRFYDAQSVRSLPNWFFKPHWSRRQRDRLVSNADTLIIVGMNESDFDQIGPTLKHSFDRILRVQLSDCNESLDPTRLTVNMGNESSWSRVFDTVFTLSPAVKIVYAAPLTWGHTHHDFLSLVNAPNDHLLSPLISMSKALQRLLETADNAAAKSQNPLQSIFNVRLQVLSLGAFVLPSDSSNQPIQGLISGFVRSLSQEIDGLNVQQIDLSDGWQDSVSELVDEMRFDTPESALALRGRLRYQQTLAAIDDSLLPQTLRHFDADGFHLVIGGLGGIGAKLVESLLENEGSNVLVVGRSSSDDARYHETFNRFAVHGARFAYCPVDICDIDALSDLIREYEQRWSKPLAYVINAAGQNHAMVLQDIVQANPLALMRTKLAGVEALQRALKQSKPDNFAQVEQWHVGSVQAYFGGAGLSLYASANSFLDAWCEHQRQQGLAVSCYQYSMWDDLGMTQGFRFQQQTLAQGYTILSAEHGVLSTRLLANVDGASSYLIGLNPSKIAMHHHAQGEFAAMRYLVADNNHVGGNEGEQSNLLKDEFGCPVHVYARDGETPMARDGQRSLSGLEIKIAEVWKTVLKLSTDIEPNDDFFELGGNSLHVTRLVNALARQLGHEPNMQTMFENSRLHQMASLMENINNGHQSDGAKSHQPIPRFPRGDLEPASFSQHRLWFLDQMQGGSHEYNILSAATLSGELNTAVLSDTLQALIERHSVLRTRYCDDDGQCMQQVVSSQALAIETINMTSLDKAAQPESVQAMMQSELNTPFNLKTDPVLRVKLLVLAENRHVLLFCMHHIASDGWSMAILSRDFMAIYRSCLSDKAPELPSLAVEYADYAHWQSQQHKNPAASPQLDYWVEQLNGLSPLLDLPTDFPRSTSRSVSGRGIETQLSADMTARLKRVCQEQGVTLFMLMQSCFALLLAKWIGARDVAIGTPVAGREHPDLENIVGFFVNTLVIRQHFDEQQNLHDVLLAGKQTVLDAFKHQNVPFDSLMDLLKVERSVAHPPLVQTMFALQNFEVMQLQLPQLTVEPLDTPLPAVRFDLELIATEEADGVSLSWNFATDLFLAKTIERLSEGFELILTAVIDAPDRPVAELSFDSLHAIEKLGELEKYQSPEHSGQASLRDPQGRRVANGMIGELHFDSAQTNESDALSAFASGQLARVRGDGQLQHMGPSNQQVLLNGYRLNLQQIEQRVRTLPGIDRLAITLADNQDSLVAYVLLSDSSSNSNIDELAVFQGLQAHLPDYMLPRAIACVDASCFDANGALLNDDLPEPTHFQSNEFVAASTDTERAMAKVWCRLLNVETVGIWDNFFELGGNSLSLTRLVLEVQDVFSQDLAMKEIYDNPTVHQLSMLLDADTAKTSSLIPHHDSIDTAPLSLSQQQIWLVHQTPEIVSQYNVPYAFKIQGALEPEILQHVFDAVIQRHQVLRTTYHDVDGVAVQRVNPSRGESVSVLDLSKQNLSFESAEVSTIIHQEAQSAFDLTSDEMIRVRLLVLSNETQVLLVTLHHIAADGWSMNVLGDEFSKLYKAFSMAQPNPLPALPIQYVDYALWQREQVNKQAGQQQLDYWCTRLAGAPLVHNLPLDKPRPTVQDFTAKLLNAPIERELLASLRHVASQHDATLFMVLQAAFAVLLARWSGEPDVVVAVPVAGRDRHETVSSIGCFTNTIALRTDVQSSLTFASLLRQSREDTVAAFAHSDVPFEQVVQGLNPPRNSAYNPLTQIKFVLQNHHENTLQIDDVSVMPMDALGEDFSQLHFDLDLSVFEQDSELSLFLSFKRDLFSAPSMRLFLDSYRNLLADIALDPNKKVAQLSLVSDTLSDDFLAVRHGNKSHQGRERPLVDKFQDVAVNFPKNVAVEMGAVELNYAQLNEKSDRLAAFLQAQEVGQGDWVLLHMSRSVSLLVAMLAVWKSGAAYIPLDTANSSERMAHILADAQPKYVLSDDTVAIKPLSSAPLETGALANAMCLQVDDMMHDDWLEAYQGRLQSCDVSLSDSAYAIYTSGSSGKPKGVDISHAALMDYCAFASDGYYANDVAGAILATSHSFDLAVPSLFLPLMHGHRVRVFTANAEITEFGELVEQGQGANFLIRLTPLHLSALIELLSEAVQYPAEHVFVIGGDVFPLSLARRLQAAFPHSRIYNHYGPTEATVGCSLFDVSTNLNALNHIVPIGQPMDNTELLVLDESLQHCPPGLPGELFIASSGLAKGYLNQPSLSEQSFVEHHNGDGTKMYRTGDRARYLPSGNLEYLGRMDDQVKVMGYRIELREVQAILLQQAQVQAAFVSTYQDKGDKKIVAYVAFDQSVSGEWDAEALKGQLALKLPTYMMPSEFVLMDALPLNDNGKIDRQRLPQPVRNAEKTDSDSLQPLTTETERSVAALWSAILDVSPEGIGRNSDFYDLGGQSLMAMRVIAALRNQLGVDLTVVDLFEAKELAQLCSLVDAQIALNNVQSDWADGVDEDDTEITL